ncbi:conserved exported hypothetical protein [Cupriavidus necator]|uniref:Extra-cytoplasmic solute receptor n=1 Tax=Cupriavidus necator TaxID=106590 RepID=A0A1K0IN97_CUPNE|nr:conserved exported hypothetical protein [Cupriavidus necator]
MHLKTMLAATLLACSAVCLADDYPNRAITFVVPSAAGGGLDVLTRTLAADMSKRMGQPIVIENKPGASGMIAAQTVARAKPDGYTVLITTSAALTNVPFVYAKVPYDVKRDLAFVTQLWAGPLVLAVIREVPAKTMKEFLEWAGQNKGKVNYGSFGVGTLGHLLGAYMSQSKGLDMTHVAYKAEAPLIQDLVGGQVTWAIATVGSLRPYFDSGRVRPLAVLGDHRSKELPNVPTLAEAGLTDPEYKPFGWVAMMAPAGTPPGVLGRLERGARTSVQTPQMKVGLQAFAMEPIGNSSADFRRDYEATTAMVERLVKAAGARID